MLLYLTDILITLIPSQQRQDSLCSIRINTLIYHLLTGSLLSVLDAQLQKYCHLRPVIEDSLYVHNVFHKFLCCGYLVSRISGCILALNKRGSVMQLKLHGELT